MNAKQITNIIQRVYKRLFNKTIFGIKGTLPQLQAPLEIELNKFLDKERLVPYQCISDLVQTLLEFGADPSTLEILLVTYKIPLTPELEAALRDDEAENDCAEDPIWDEVHAMNAKED